MDRCPVETEYTITVPKDLKTGDVVNIWLDADGQPQMKIYSGPVSEWMPTEPVTESLWPTILRWVAIGLIVALFLVVAALFAGEGR